MEVRMDNRIAKPPQQRLEVPRDVVARRFPQQTVLLNVATGQYHGLNGTAAELFDLVRDTGSADAAARTYSDRTGHALELIAADLERLVRDLLQRGLLRHA